MSYMQYWAAECDPQEGAAGEDAEEGFCCLAVWQSV